MKIQWNKKTIAGAIFGGLMAFGAIHNYMYPEVAQERKAKAQAAQIESAKASEAKALKEKLGTDQAAMRIAQQFVKKVIKSPTSAKFSGETAILHETTWGVKGNVDSQNSFGAMIRDTYVCQVQHQDGDKWTLVEPCIFQSQMSRR